jgi:transposase
MAKGYAKDLRVRAVQIVEAGESAREAGRLLHIGASTAIRWIERWTTTGSVDAKPAPATASRCSRSTSSGCSTSSPPSRT